MEINEEIIKKTKESLTRLFERKHNELSRDSGMDFYNYVKQKAISVIGLGGVGSWLSFVLSRFSPYKLYLIDGDTVEEGNLGGQLFGNNSCGDSKVSAVHDYINYMNIGFNSSYIYTDYSYVSRINKISGTIPDYVFMGIDNMSGRKLLYESWKELMKQVPEDQIKTKALIDIRMSVDTIQIYVVTYDEYSLKKYEESLFTDDEADAVVCNRKQTTYVCALCSGLLGNTLVEHIRYVHLNYPPPPFMREYDANLLTLKEYN